MINLITKSIWKTLTIILIVATCVVGIYADEGDGGQAGEFLRYGASVRSLALGRAYVAQANDAAGLFYNPAGLLLQNSQYSGYFMHSRPMGLSSYNFMAFTLPRPSAQANGGAGWLFGPNSAWGIAAVNLSSDDFDHRGENDEQLPDGSFGIYQQAAILGYAREFAGPSGVLGLGLNFKFIHQGIRDATSIEDSDFGFGMDLGAQLQLLSPSLLGNSVSLKHLIPLRLGLSIQNIIPPKVGFGSEQDKYPTTARFGWSYSINRLFGNDSLGLQLLNDYEILFSGERGTGIFAGAEVNWIKGNAILSPRFGFNKIGESKAVFTLGTGISYKFSWADASFDAAWGRHDRLDNDLRVALSFRFGKTRDSRYFGDDHPAAMSSTARHIQVVSRYPAHPALLEIAATALATEEDTVNARRYYELIKGYGWAYKLYLEAKKDFQADKRGEAFAKALESARQYKLAIDKNMTPVDAMGPRHGRAFGEAWLLAAVCDPTGEIRSIGLDSSFLVLEQATDSSVLKYYLMGMDNLFMQNHKEAAEYFGQAIEATTGDSVSLKQLSTILMTECHVLSNESASILESDLIHLRDLIANYTLPLKDNYPRYLIFSDNDLADDAQYWIARITAETSNSKVALLEYAKICRFYPGKDRCRDHQTAVEMEQHMK